MIELKDISSDIDLEKFNIDLLQKSFPKEEYRDLNVLKQYIQNKSIFYPKTILLDKKPIGIFHYWQLEEYFYIEHFAISSEHRNKGLGEACLSHIQQTILNNKTIVLEVEIPNSKIAIRRINFYKRLGFHLMDFEYYQPPYKKDYNQIEMKLMINKQIDKIHILNKIRNLMYLNIYNTH